MSLSIIAESLDNRIERFNSWKDKQPHFISRGIKYNPEDNVVAIISRMEGNHTLKETLYGRNIVTNDGDLYYAQSAVAETPTSDFDGANGRLVLRNAAAAATPAKTDTYNELNVSGTGALDAAATDYQALNATYPKTNDADGDNTGTGTDIVTWLYDWLTSELNTTGIVGGGIVVKSADPPANADKLLNHFTIASFDKTSSDTLKMFVNHTINGV